MYISLVRQIGFPIHFISVAHCCPLKLIEDITEMWQDACHIWKHYITKCYKMLVMFTYNERHYVSFTKITQHCYSPDWLDTYFLLISPNYDFNISREKDKISLQTHIEHICLLFAEIQACTFCEYSGTKYWYCCINISYNVLMLSIIILVKKKEYYS